jgi:hypothetical protein
MAAFASVGGGGTKEASARVQPAGPIQFLAAA